MTQLNDFKDRIAQLPERDVAGDGAHRNSSAKGTLLSALYPLTYLLALVVAPLSFFLSAIIFVNSGLLDGQGPFSGSEMFVLLDGVAGFLVIFSVALAASTTILACFHALTVPHFMLLGVGFWASHNFLLL